MPDRILLRSTVLIKGLMINVVAPGAGSLLVNADARVIIEDCIIRYGSGGPGIDFQAAGVLPELTVKDTTIMWIDGTGVGPSAIRILPSGSTTVDALLDNVTIRTNTSGITIDGRNTTGSNLVTLRNTTVTGSSSIGVNVIDSGGGATNVTIEGSTLSNNGTHAVAVGGATVRMRDSTVTGNFRGLLVNAGGQIISLGGNSVTGNTTNGAFSSTVAQQ